MFLSKLFLLQKQDKANKR